MKKASKSILFTALCMLFLTACGTSQESESTTKTAESDENKTEQESVSEGETQNEQETNEQDANPQVQEQKIKYEQNGKDIEEVAFLQYNDNQNYSIYVLPQYELTAEEPNRDILYLTENDQVFMRIELLPEDANWSEIEENTKLQLAAVNDDVQTIEAPVESYFENTVAMEVTNGTDVVTALLIKNNELPLKLTIFSKSDLDVKDAFVQMAKTIIKGQPQE